MIRMLSVRMMNGKMRGSGDSTLSHAAHLETGGWRLEAGG